MESLDIELLIAPHVTEERKKRLHPLTIFISNLMGSAPTVQHMMFELTSAHPTNVVSTTDTTKVIDADTFVFETFGCQIKTDIIVECEQLPYMVLLTDNNCVAVYTYTDDEQHLDFIAAYPAFFSDEYVYLYKDADGNEVEVGEAYESQGY